MIVCVCNRVSDRDIVRLAKSGCMSFDDLQMETGVSTCCGCCETCARQTFDAARDASSPPRIAAHAETAYSA
jgi:bacterioferritin-associated ferredoxin